MHYKDTYIGTGDFVIVAITSAAMYIQNLIHDVIEERDSYTSHVRSRWEDIEQRFLHLTCTIKVGKH